MDAKDWLLFVGPLLGVLMGGFLASVAKLIELRHQRKMEQNKVVLARVEELYDLLIRYPVIWIETLDKYYGGISNETFGKLIGTGFVQAPVVKVDLIIDLYFPELRPRLERIYEIEKEVASQYVKLMIKRHLEKSNVAVQESPKNWILNEDFGKEFRKLEKETADTMREAAKLGRKYTHLRR